MIQKTSPDWPGTKKFLEQMIANAFEALADPYCEPRSADQHRGAIQACRNIIAKVEPTGIETKEFTAPPRTGY